MVTVRRRLGVIPICLGLVAALAVAGWPDAARAQYEPPSIDAAELDDLAALLEPLPAPPALDEVLGAGITPAQRLCAAEPTLFRSRGDDQRLAGDLMAGRLTIRPFTMVRLPANPTWSEVLVKQSNWEVKYQALTWLDPLRREYLRTGDPAMLERYRFLIQDFMADNPRAPRGRSRWTWYDHPTGHRSSVLACATTVLRQPGWLTEGICAHVAALSEPAYYKGWGNHSLMQNSGLFSLGCVLGDLSARGLATERSDTLLRRAVDQQGVIDEGSLGYHQANHAWWSELRRKFQACAGRVPDSFSRIDLMPQFVADATQPGGRVTPFGDTFLGDRGTTDPSPSGLTAFYKRGYLFSRSGTGTARPLNRESMLSLRYGQAYNSQAHGHMDAGNLEFFAYGEPLISDSGMHAYGSGYWRRFVKSPAAHNVLSAHGAAYRRDRTTPMTYRKVTSGHTVASIASTVITGANWKRTVAYSRRGGWVLVDDQIQQTSNRTMTQRWNLSLDSSFRITPGKRVDEIGRRSESLGSVPGRRPKPVSAQGMGDPGQALYDRMAQPEIRRDLHQPDAGGTEVRVDLARGDSVGSPPGGLERGDRVRQGRLRVGLGGVGDDQDTDGSRAGVPAS